MPLFAQEALNPGVKKREVFGWAMYDFANSGYTTVVLTAVFNAYFVGVVADGADWGTLAWTLTLALSNFIIMFTMPAIGAYADLRAAKKRLLMLTTAACVVSTLALFWVGRNDVALAVVAIVLSNLFYAYGEALTAAFLPELAKREALGKVSGWGWSFGYFGGMLSLGLSLAYVIWAQKQGQKAEQFVPVTMVITAAVYGVSALVTFALLKERAVPQGGASHSLRDSLARLRTTWQQAQRFEDFRWLLITALAYQAGIGVIIALAAVYAEQALGFKQTDTMMLVFLVNIASAVGAFAFGYWQDRTGHKRALAVTLVGWIVMCGIGGADDNRRAVLGGCGDRRAVHGLEPIGGPRDRRPARAAAAARRVLRPVDLCDAAVGDRRAGDLWVGDLGDGGQPSPRHRFDRGLLRHRPRAAAPRGCRARREAGIGEESGARGLKSNGRSFYRATTNSRSKTHEGSGAREAGR